MPRDDKPRLHPSRLYSLKDAYAQAGISPSDVIRLACRSELFLCALIPGGKRAFVVDPASVITFDSQAIVNRQFQRAKPDRDLGHPIRREEAIAVVLDGAQCHQLEDIGVMRQSFFYSAYVVPGGLRVGAPLELIRVAPQRLPLFGPDGKGETDQSRQRFAVYPVSTTLTFVEDLGYPEPEDVVVTWADVQILGSELLRLPAPSTLTPEEPDAGTAHADAGTSAPLPRDGTVSGVAEKTAVERRPAATGEIRPTVPPIKEVLHPQAEPKSESPVRSDALKDERGPLVLLPREEVERRINKGKSWIYERIKKTHPNFDPTFPQPIKIGGNVGWIESEIEAWCQAQILKNRT